MRTVFQDATWVNQENQSWWERGTCGYLSEVSEWKTGKFG